MAADPSLVIEAHGLVKRYGSVVALDGLDLAVPAGSILGLLGPNGAGKTTAVSILTTLLVPDAGEAVVAGAHLGTEPERVRERIGLSGQYAAVDEVLTARENLRMIGRLYRLGRAEANRRADDLLERFSLADAADRPVRGFSGGMRRRLDLACALTARPPVLFLDEPTTGLDPRSRNDLWDVLRELVDDGATLLLTTQYLEEADQLADNIVVIDHGRAIAEGTSDELKAQLGSERLEVQVADAADRERVEGLLARHARPGAEVRVTGTRSLQVSIPDGLRSLEDAVADLRENGVTVSDVGLRRPTLDDVFLTLTGSATSDGATVDHPGREEAS